jgi:hypothetical protein
VDVILHKLPTLETLCLDYIRFRRNDVVAVNPVLKGNIKNLTIGISGCNRRIEEANQIMAFALESCPELEQFTLNSDTEGQDYEVLRLYFVMIN